MKIDRKKLDIAMARKCLSMKDIMDAGMSSGTINGLIKNNYMVQPKTAGRLAKAIGCDVTEIIED